MHTAWSSEALPARPDTVRSPRAPGDLPARPRRPSLGRDVLALARPGQWAKNVLVVPVAILDLDAWSLAAIGRLCWAVVALTIASIFVYVVNDIVDRHRDGAHPTKRHRPIAGGRVPVPGAILLAVVLLGVLVAVASLQPWIRSWPVACYLVLAMAYSAALKHVSLVDVFVVATGFALRLMQGYVAIGIAASGWLVICVFSLCLLLTIGKRRQELAATGGGFRPALRGYTLPLIDQLMVLSAVLSAGTYLLYLRTEAPLEGYGPAAAVLLAPLALFGLFRYLQLVLVHAAGENPVRLLLRDPPLVVNSLLWAALSAVFLLATRL